MKFVQFRLHSIIPSYNYFVYNSVNKLLIFSNANSTGRWVGGEGAGVVVSFSKIRTFARGIPPQRTCKDKGGEGAVQKTAILWDCNN